MAQVPYSPVPTAQPQAPGESISENTPGAAFGENVGAALQHLGSSVGEVGNELFSRAIALQDLNNENSARNQASAYWKTAGEKQAQYDSLEGKAKVDALSGHLQDLEDLRQKYRSGLDSPNARKFFDADASALQRSLTLQSSRQAGDANKKYSIDTLAAQNDLFANHAGADPTDLVTFNQTLNAGKNNVIQQVMLQHGIDDPNHPLVKDAVANWQSRMVKARIDGLSLNQPLVAQELFYKDKALLNDTDRQIVEGRLNGKVSAVASSNISDQVLARHLKSDGTYDASYQDMQKEVKDESAKQFPDNALLPQAAVSAFDTKIIRARFAAQQDKADVVHQIDTAIMTHNVSDTQELFAIPGMDKIVERYGKLDPKGAAELQGHIFNVNQAANRVTKEQSLAYIYHGLANGGPDGSMDEFLKVDPYDPKWHLNVSDARAVVKKQFEVSKSMTADPKVNNAMNAIVGSMGGQLDDLNVIGRSKDNEKYYAFKGALGAALEEWQMENKRPASNEEIVQKIGPAIVRQMASPPSTVFGVSIPFTGGNQPAFELLQQHVQDVVAEAKKRNTEVPSEDEIRRAYMQQTFQQLFGGSGGGSKSGPADSIPE